VVNEDHAPSLAALRVRPNGPASRVATTKVPFVERADPEQYQPRLGFWDHLWRLAVAAALSGVFASLVIAAQWDHHRVLFVVDMVLGAASFGLVLLRRRYPWQVAALLNALAVVSATASGPAILAAVSLATRRKRREVISLAVLIFVASTLFYVVQPMDRTRWWVLVLTNLAFATLQLGWGMYLGSRRELYYQLRRRVAAAEAERDERAARARAQERSRIAREMHDVLAHRITQMSMLSGAMTIREDLDADALRDAAGVIQRNAKDALADLRGVLGVLRDASTGAPLSAPQPTYRDIPRLVASSREAGVNVVLRQDLDLAPEEVPANVGRTAYRIVQEGITNAARHAPGARLEVSLHGGPERGLHVVLRNPLGFGGHDASGAGLGLIGLAERAELSGGRLTHAASGSEFLLEGWIPWPA
jgi:signal transduction histidine kinase